MEEIGINLDSKCRGSTKLSGFDLDQMGASFSDYLASRGSGTRGCASFRYDITQGRYEVVVDIAAVCKELSMNPHLVWLPTEGV